METDFQPSFFPMINVLPRKDLPGFMTSLAAFLAAKIGEYPRILADIADPSSLIYVHIKMVFETMISYPPGLMEDDVPYFFHEYVIRPALAFIGLGEKVMAMNLGAQIRRGQNSPSNPPKPGPPLPPKIAEPVRQVVSPPRQPPASSWGGGRQAPTSAIGSSENKLYMSKLPPGAIEDAAKMRRILVELQFPPNLSQVPFGVLKMRKEGVQACILVGPTNYPQWADQMIAYKPHSSIRESEIHMSKAKPRSVVHSPGRAQRREDLAARLNNIALGVEPPTQASHSPRQRSPAEPSSRSPMQQSPTAPSDSSLSGSVSSGAGGTRKRGPPPKREGQTRLEFDEGGGENMQISSPSPVRRSKVSNSGPTPALMREQKRLIGQGSESSALEGGGASLALEGDVEVVDAGGSSMDNEEEEEEEDPFALGDAAPPATEENKVRGDETKGDGDVMPN